MNNNNYPTDSFKNIPVGCTVWFDGNFWDKVSKTRATTEDRTATIDPETIVTIYPI